MNYDNFRSAVGREYEAWKQQRQQQEGQGQRPGRLEIGGQVQNVDQLSEGMVLQRQGRATNETIRIVSVDNDTVRYQWKKEDGSWSTRTRRRVPSSFVDRGYVLKEREGDEQAAPRAAVGERVQSADRLRVGDIIRSAPGRERKILEITGNQIKTQRIDSQGRPQQSPQTYSITNLANHKMVEHADEGPRKQIGESVSNTDELRVGDFIENDHLANHGIVRKVVEILSNGNLRTQRMSARSGSPVGNVEEIPKEQIERRGRFSGYGQYKRVADPTEGAAARAERERQQREEQARREEEERRRQEGREQPHVGVGETINHPRALRVGDTFRNSYLEGMNKYRKVVEIRPNGQVMTQLFNENGRSEGSPEPFRAEAIRQYGPYKRFMGPGHTVESPEDVGKGTYIKKDDRLYRVVHRTSTRIEVQDVHEGRGVGRPTTLSKRDLESGDYKIAVTPARAETGERLTSLNDLRSGQVVKAMHHRTPKWVRVESIGADKVKVQPVNSQTGEPEGDAEELSTKDLKTWAYLAKTGNLPEALLPPLEAPPGGFAPPGQGKLTPNFQPGRYDDVRIRMTGATEERMRQLLGLPEGEDPKHVLADLAGAGGIATSLASLSISVDGYGGRYSVSVTGSGTHIRNMSRTITFRDGAPYSLSNDHFKLASSAPKGMGLKMFATQVGAGLKYGFKHISVSAAGSGPWRDGQYNGYYVWPRFGYDGAFSSSYFERMPRHIQDKIREIRPSAPSGLRFLDVMMAGEEARKWWKDNGTSSSLKFKLGAQSRSVQYLTDYVRAVARKEAEVGADQYLNRAAAEEGNDTKHEWYPTFGPDEEQISDAIWDRLGEDERKKNEKKKRNKKATAYLVDLASEDPLFRQLLRKELLKG